MNTHIYMSENHFLVILILEALNSLIIKIQKIKQYALLIF